jgi:hypothetical protein
LFFFNAVQCLKLSEILVIISNTFKLKIKIYVDEMCFVCRKACLDRFGEHAVHCQELLGFKYKYDFVRDILFDVFKRA